MSERSDVVPVPEGEYLETNRFSGLSLLLAVVGLISLGLCVVGAFVDRHQFSFSWLFAFAFFFTLIAGCFFWIIVHHVYGCGMVGRRPPAVGKSGHAHAGDAACSSSRS